MKTSAPMQRKAAPAPAAPALAPPRGFGPAPEGVHPAVLRPSAGGAPLPSPVRAKMEGALGHDFSDVRVHQGGEASSIGALAFARGSHVHFAPGQYRPHSADGQRILAHELAHVVQQREGRVPCPGGAVPINDDARLEREADAAATRGTRLPPLAAPADAAAATGAGALQRLPAHQTPIKRAREKADEPPEVKLNRLQNSKSSEWVPYGYGQGRKLMNVPKADSTSGPQGMNKIETMFMASKNLQKPRSYEGERTPQVLRWISTVLNQYAEKEKPREVQTSLSKGRLFTSSNMNAANDKLRATENQNANDALLSIIKKLGANTGREGRHLRKLGSLLNGDRGGTGYTHIMNALKKPFTVPKSSTSDDGLHAERRLKHHLGDDDFEDATTRGTKRPCAVCFLKNYDGLGGTGQHPKHPGAFWPGSSATLGLREDELPRLAKLQTHASRMMEGDYTTVDYDTDSDSEFPLKKKVKVDGGQNVGTHAKKKKDGSSNESGGNSKAGKKAADKKFESDQRNRKRY